MTKVCVIGGKLQGVEALYLAKKAGMETTLIDKSKSPLGKKFCGRFICKDVLQYNTDLVNILEEADFVLPALENLKVLSALKEISDKHNINLVYDPHAYSISSSKQISDRMMHEEGLPCPRYYPEGDFPYIAKPSNSSCSEGVTKIYTKNDLEIFLSHENMDTWIVEEYLSGPSYSLEVIGTPGKYHTYHVTELLMDPEYDCKTVLSRPDLSSDLKNQLKRETIALAEMVKLHGIMDVEVIETNGVLRILEIDARIPSQTPIAVYHATGWNMMTEMAVCFGKNPPQSSELWPQEKYVSLEHILVEGCVVRVLGEHIMGKASMLDHKYNFCGADEALTDYAPGKECWAATLICVAETKADLAEKRKNIPASVEKLIGRDIEFFNEYPAEL